MCSFSFAEYGWKIFNTGSDPVYLWKGTSEYGEYTFTSGLFPNSQSTTTNYTTYWKVSTSSTVLDYTNILISTDNSSFFSYNGSPISLCSSYDPNVYIKYTAPTPTPTPTPTPVPTPTPTPQPTSLIDGTFDNVNNTTTGLFTSIGAMFTGIFNNTWLTFFVIVLPVFGLVVSIFYKIFKRKSKK